MFGEKAIIGAGTVLKDTEAREAASAGARIIVSPNYNEGVVRETKKLGLESWPGVLTPSECFAALAVGADGLKLFPCSVLGPSGVQAMRAVLPPPATRFVELIEKACGRKAEIQYAPMQPGDVPETYAEIEASRRDLGFEPKTPIDEGVPNFVAWFREYHKL